MKMLARPSVLLGAVISVIALSLAGLSAAWVAGALGISAAAASQIVTAIQVGGWALTAVGFIFGAGVIGAIIGTVRWYLVRRGRAVAIA